MAKRHSTWIPPQRLIYFVQAGIAGPVKIGKTDKPIKERLAALQTANPEELRLLGTLNEDQGFTERYLHRRFEHLHIRGEWFRLGGDLVEFILCYVTLPDDEEPRCVFVRNLRPRGRVEMEELPKFYMDNGATWEQAHMDFRWKIDEYLNYARKADADRWDVGLRSRIGRYIQEHADACFARQIRTVAISTDCLEYRSLA